ncbi:MAG: transcriptional regulator [Deltaproteobacteria bacterium]|nr:transcriptional regulator [Deltaproteobacteria bacterium]
MPEPLSPSKPERPAWEDLALEAVGTVIEFWGFKRNQGRVWALLYLRGQALSAAQIQHGLALSKGATSVLVRELEHWGVLRRVRRGSDRTWRFEAEQDLMAMVRRVLEHREGTLVSRVTADLARAEALVRQDRAATPEVRARVGRMLALARATEHALDVFRRTAHLDAAPVVEALVGAPASVRRRLARLAGRSEG